MRGGGGLSSAPKAGKFKGLSLGRLVRQRSRIPQSKKRKLVAELTKALGADRISPSVEALPNPALSYWPLLLLAVRQGRPLASPDLVVHPRSTEEASKAVRIAYRLGVPVVPYGGGSGVVGSTYPLRGGLLMDLSRMNRILGFEEADQVITAEAGAKGDTLESFLNQRGYSLGHIPQSLHISTVGGWIAAGSSGQLSTGYGSIEDMLQGVVVVLANGRIVSLGRRPRSAYATLLHSLFVGSEGSLGVITEATIKVRKLPPSVILDSYVCKGFPEALDSVRQLIQSGIRPPLVRVYDGAEASFRFGDFLKGEDDCLILFALEGHAEVIGAEHSLLRKMLEAKGLKSAGPMPVEKWMKERFDAIKELEKYLDMGLLIDTIDVAGGWNTLPALYASVKEALLSVEGALFVGAHASHFYETGGCLYFTVAGRRDDFVGFYSHVWHRAMEACLRVGGVITHHHGVGLARLPWLEEAFGDEAYILRKIKKSLDAKGIMNPKLD